MKRTAGLFLVLVSLVLAGCDGDDSATGTGTGSGGSGDTKVKSITDLPSISTMVSTSSTSSTISAKGVDKTASGTPPLLTGITSSNVDTYFWNGLLATINAAGSATDAQQDSFWEGEGACRMAQTVGYAFQNILQGGTSLCYMQNAPKSANGVAIVSGDDSLGSLFNQDGSNKIIQVQVSDGAGNSEDVFIKVYGTGSTEGAAGYAADLWFCSPSDVVTGYEQIRISDTSFTTTSVGNDFGSFVATISASLTTNSAGQKIFDPTKTRSATVYFQPAGASFTFLGSVSIDSSGLLTARDYQNGNFGGGTTQTNKHAIFANYSGSTMDALRFSSASFALQDVYGSTQQSTTGATEFQDTRYATVASGDLLTKAQAEDFSSAIYKGDTSSYVTLLSATSGFSCTETPGVVVSMDMSASGPMAVAATCENDFTSMDFCDGSTVRAARDIVISGQTSQGSCSTSFCSNDFSCQQWADNNIGNSAGITTANAQCQSGCCGAR